MRHAVLVALALLAFPHTTHAAFPGVNGKIAFNSGNPPSVVSMNSDGTGQTVLRSGLGPQWSPDGARIAFTRSGVGSGCDSYSKSSIYTMPADGSSETLVKQSPPSECIHPVIWRYPAWSSDGSQFTMSLFTCEVIDWCDNYLVVNDGVITRGGNSTWRPYGAEIAYTSFHRTEFPEGLWGIRSDGTGDHAIWEAPYSPDPRFYWPANDPDYSPTGGEILFSSTYPDDADEEIYSISATGGSPVRLTNNAATDSGPVWSPDGKKVAFGSNRDGNFEIYTMNADGTNQTRITNDPGGQGNPSWQPLPYPSYARPKGATPTRLSLVNAYRQCTSSNREHGPPLVFGSCNPPVPESNELTIGTPDSNGAQANFTGYVQYASIVGNPGTPADEADIALRVEITDVREQGTLDDYAGELRAGTTVRLTDRTASAGDPATSNDVLLPLVTQCSPTALTVIGSTCSLDTTLDALIPGAISEGQRTMLQLGQVSVIDGGPDGDTDTTPNSVFLRQGIFVP